MFWKGTPCNYGNAFGNSLLHKSQKAMRHQGFGLKDIKLQVPLSWLWARNPPVGLQVLLSKLTIGRPSKLVLLFWFPFTTNPESGLKKQKHVLPPCFWHKNHSCSNPRKGLSHRNEVPVGANAAQAEMVLSEAALRKGPLAAFCSMPQKNSPEGRRNGVHSN